MRILVELPWLSAQSVSDNQPRSFSVRLTIVSTTAMSI